MSYCATLQMSVPFMPTIRYGVSEASKRIEQFIDEAKLHNSNSITLGWREQLYGELENLLQECSKSGWDGYDANPISSSLKGPSKAIIDLLPEGIIHPDIVPEATGDIAIEWNVNNQDLLSISISNKCLIFAGVFKNGKKIRGEEGLSDELPKIISDLLSKHFTSKGMPS